MLGVCLGHQAIGQIFGGKVVRAPLPVHGKPAEICHDGKGVFADLSQNFQAGRYHSLVVERESLPDELEISAITPDGLIMGLRHKELQNRRRAVSSRINFDDRRQKTVAKFSESLR